MLKTAAFLVSTVIAASTLIAQQPPAGQGPPGGGQRGGGGGMRGPAPIAYEDHTGFQQIFDGKSLKNWDGDPAFWRVEGDAIVGESTDANPVKQNTFMIYRGGEPGDFELKVEFRINNTNSGVQYRSVQVPADDKTGKWVLKGYQADIDFTNQYTGQIYEERGRTFLAMRGQFSRVTPEGVVQGVASLQTGPSDLKGIFNINGWNQVHLIARGNLITEIVNGQVTSVLLDDDPKGRAMKGLMGFQMHMGPPMKVEFRNIWLKQY